MKRKSERSSSGFTLIEVIVSIIIVAILGTFLVSYMAGGITKSSLLINTVKQEFEIFKVMEQITADYQKKVPSSSSELLSFESNITSEYNTNGVTVSCAFINIDRTDGTFSSSDSTNGLILRVMLQKGDQSIAAFFTR
jgi:prepilin-type N-terminal cleavage/methylation domain-containing protein